MTMPPLKPAQLGAHFLSGKNLSSPKMMHAIDCFVLQFIWHNLNLCLSQLSDFKTKYCPFLFYSFFCADISISKHKISFLTYSRLLRCSKARGSSTGLFLVSPTKAKARQSWYKCVHPRLSSSLMSGLVCTSLGTGENSILITIFISIQ